jgi:hypothetical protein
MALRKRGRPAFKVTPALRDKVELLVSVGMSHDDIGRAIGCNHETLRKHFADEIEHGAARKRAETAAMLHRAAKKGSVTAQRALDALQARASAEAAFCGPDASVEPRARVKAERPQKLGKKEEAAASATAMLQDEEWGADIAASLGIDAKRPQ